MEKLDTSNLPLNHLCYTDIRKKVPGVFSDETGGKSIRELVALRSKSYGYNLVGVEHIKSKGVSRHVIKHHITIKDHLDCLFKGLNSHITPIDYTPYREMKTFKSYKHIVYTTAGRKLALNRYDDKRVVLEDQIHTLAHGHYRIK